ncbi:MAG: TetR family transcriptional regulator [Granulosicoccaceae bacterium]
MTKPPSTADAILDTAMRLANIRSWEKLSLHAVAQEMVISLDEIYLHYTQKDDLVEAWYDRADRAMLKAVQAPGYSELTPHERLHFLIMRWLDTLAEYKTVSRDMLLYKLEPAHVHLQLQGILRISRTVQWIREAARLDATHLCRITEEIGLTTLYVQTFLYWMSDNSTGQARTRQFLHRRLRLMDKGEHFMNRLRCFIPGRATRHYRHAHP